MKIYFTLLTITWLLYYLSKEDNNNANGITNSGINAILSSNQLIKVGICPSKLTKL